MQYDYDNPPVDFSDGVTGPGIVAVAGWHEYRHAKTRRGIDDLLAEEWRCEYVGAVGTVVMVCEAMRMLHKGAA